ncbi:MAG: hypothetical protein FAF05_06990 [Epsilonproteobacteria bacterium]|nr:hypothetical protein [Campylobacterota bacterium]
MVRSDDGSFTAYSKEYNEHYHSTKDGALKESLLKHVKPALEIKKTQNEIKILDICFGLGLNTLTTLWYYDTHKLGNKLKIYSPEFDVELIDSLVHFRYPNEFTKYLPIIQALVEDGVYEDEYFFIELFRGDARGYIKKFADFFDVVYQDAFSPAVNPVLWTQEYFADIAKAIKDDGVLTTYSTALKTRLALHYNGFEVYLNTGDGFRNATVASLIPLKTFQKVDMEHKITCNPDMEPLRD